MFRPFHCVEALFEVTREEVSYFQDLPYVFLTSCLSHSCCYFLLFGNERPEDPLDLLQVFFVLASLCAIFFSSAIQCHLKSIASSLASPVHSFMHTILWKTLLGVLLQ